MLHISNGDQASQRLSTLPIKGDQLAWNDVLHEGPLPSGLTLEEMSKIRAAFIAGRGWATSMEAQLHFQTRDTILQSGAEEGEVVYWLTPELYDHLHLIQLAAWFGQEANMLNPPKAVVLDHGFHELSDQTLLEAFEQRYIFTGERLERFVRLWEAITAASPRSLEAVLQDEALWLNLENVFPMLKTAMVRLCCEYPDASGISLTQRYVLESLSQEASVPFDLFRAVRSKEAFPFMGDASFWLILREMMDNDAPLIEWRGQGEFTPPELMGFNETFTNGVIAITENGKTVLNGSDWLNAHSLDRWVGGVRLTLPGCWRFDSQSNRFFRT